MATRLTIPLEIEERAALTKLAKSQKREERRQAAYIIRRELEKLNLLEPQIEPDHPAQAGGQAA